jgi:hypothetical protein
MTGPDHWREAELLLEDSCDYGCPHTGCDHEMARLARAQVHATLTLAAATALAQVGMMPVFDADAWQDTAGTQPGASQEQGAGK